MTEDADYVEFWKAIAEKQMNNAEVYEALGKTFLYTENIEEAIKAFKKAISLNAMKNILHIDLGKFYMMQAMQNRALLDSIAPLIEKEFEIYLKSQPEPIIPLKAYITGQLAMIKLRTGDEEAGNKLKEEAKMLDPNYSKAFGAPNQILFDPPDVISRVLTFFFRPF
jgi:tetratricopeptide (TPR) repeat protein